VCLDMVGVQIMHSPGRLLPAHQAPEDCGGWLH
jgi:hypothetical protein